MKKLLIFAILLSGSIEPISQNNHRPLPEHLVPRAPQNQRPLHVTLFNRARRNLLGIEYKSLEEQRRRLSEVERIVNCDQLRREEIHHPQIASRRRSMMARVYSLRERILRQQRPAEEQLAERLETVTIRQDEGTDSGRRVRRSLEDAFNSVENNGD